MPATPPLSSHTLAQDSQAADALTSDSTHLSNLFGLQGFASTSVFVNLFVLPAEVVVVVFHASVFKQI